MISHALTILSNELNKHLTEVYGSTDPQAQLGNLADITASGSNTSAREMLYISVVNIKEEKTLKNLPNYTNNSATLKAVYENPPVFLNLLVLLSATHRNYSDALLVLSRAIRFFQSRNVFTQDNVSPESITKYRPTNSLDQLEAFKLTLDLYSPTLEEVNHLWGTLSGKQYPFVLYVVRVLEMKFGAVQEEGGLITEVVTNAANMRARP